LPVFIREAALALKSLFKNRSLFHLWAGQTISQMGDSLYEIGLLWLMLEVTGSKTLTGLVAMSSYLPTLLFGLFAGAFADRFNRKKIMLWADSVRIFLVLLIPLAWYAFSLNALFLALITFSVAMLNSFFNPARDAIIPQLVEKEEIFRANSMMQTTWQISLLGGPLFAGIILSLTGVVHLFTIDAATFLLSLLFIASIRYKPLTIERQTQSIGAGIRDAGSEVLAGLRYALKHPVIRILLFFTAIDNIFIMGPAIVGLPIFVKEILRESSGVYAVAQASMAGGMLTGTFILHRFFRRSKINIMLIVGIILDGLTYFPLYYADSALFLWTALFIHGLAIPLIIIPRPTIVHTLVPKEYQGRIFAMINMAVVGFTAISAALTGLISEYVPINVIFGTIAVFAALTGALGWLSEDFRNLSK
jgi:MFS family permease